jgi:DNA-binding NarL/FixJ family response regulator
MNPVRIVFAYDHDVVRSGFATLLDSEPEFTVGGTAHTGLKRFVSAVSSSPT